MALIGLFCPDEAARRDLTLAVEELGHRVAPAAQLREGLELLGELKPEAVIVASGEGDRLAESYLGEADRLSPMTPVLVALLRRDAARAVELLKAGAYEVIAPPWTRESLSSCLSKAVRLKGTAFELPAPKDRRREALFYALALGVCCALAFGYRALARRVRASEQAALRLAHPQEVELPYSHPAGMASDGRSLWVADWYGQAVHRHDPAAMELKRSIPLPALVPVALAAGREAFWIAGASGTVSRHLPDDKLTFLSRYPEPLPRVAGMVYDGLYLWTADARGRLRKHLPDDRLTVLAEYAYPGSKPAALAFDGSRLWSLDAGNRELLEHDARDPRQVLRRLPLRAYQGGGWRPTGLAWDGSGFWSVAESTSGDRPARAFRHAVPGAGRP